MPVKQSDINVKKNKTMVKIYLLPPIVKLLVAVALFFFLCIVGFQFLKSQSAEDYSQLQNQKELLQKEVAKSAQSYGQLRFLSKNTQLAKQQYDELLKQFPTESQIGGLLSSITKTGTSEGLRFVSFKPMASKNKDFYSETSVEITVTGHYHQIGRFLSEIANLQGSVVGVNELTLTSNDPKSGLLRLDFVATLYYIIPSVADVKI